MKRLKECDYSYVSPDGLERFFKRRYRLSPVINGRTKTFRLYTRLDALHIKRGIPKEWGHLIYNLPAVVEEARRGGVVWWVEGEKDAQTLAYEGEIATSHWNPRAASVEQARWLVGAEEVVLLYDNDEDDENGGNAGALDLLLRYKACRAAGIPRGSIAVGHAASGKDVTDHLTAGLDLDDMIWLDSLAPLRVKAKKTLNGGGHKEGYADPETYGFTGSLVVIKGGA